MILKKNLTEKRIIFPSILEITRNRVELNAIKLR